MSVNDIRTEPTTELFEVQQGSTDSNATFIFGNEDHTLGNMLRYVLMQRTDVEFCAYSGTEHSFLYIFKNDWCYNHITYIYRIRSPTSI
jgi:DNA-directed RNA polymerase subunit L